MFLYCKVVVSEWRKRGALSATHLYRLHIETNCYAQGPREHVA